MPVYKLGDMVRIKSGPFAAFTGKIEGINQAKALLKVVVEIFGRVTPVKLKFSEVHKLSFADDDDSFGDQGSSPRTGAR